MAKYFVHLPFVCNPTHWNDALEFRKTNLHTLSLCIHSDWYIFPVEIYLLKHSFLILQISINNKVMPGQTFQGYSLLLISIFFIMKY